MGTGTGYGARVRRTDSLTVQTSTFTTIAWQEAVTSTLAGIWSAGDPTKLFNPVGSRREYALVSCCVIWTQEQTVGDRLLRILKNGAEAADCPAKTYPAIQLYPTDPLQRMSLHSALIALPEGAYVQAQVWQGGGSDITLYSGNVQHFSLMLAGAETFLGSERALTTSFATWADGHAVDWSEEQFAQARVGYRSG